MKYYAIMQKSTGYFLPDKGSRKGKKGYTHDEPEPRHKYPPRLFMKRHLAECALRWWLEGSWTETFDYEGRSNGPEARKQSGRDPKDMAIMCVDMSIMHDTIGTSDGKTK